jgi:hypothetical protein
VLGYSKIHAAKNKDFTALFQDYTGNGALLRLESQVAGDHFISSFLLFLDQGTGMGGAKGEPSISGERQGLGGRG